MAESLSKDYDRTTEKTYSEIKDTKYKVSNMKFGAQFKDKPLKILLYESSLHFGKGTCCCLYCMLSIISFIFSPNK